MMKVFIGGRRSGKTTEAIKESHATGKYILVMNKIQAADIFRTAMNMKVLIPYPITLKELMSYRVYEDIRKNGIIVDEAQRILEKVLDTNIHMITVNKDEVSNDQ